MGLDALAYGLPLEFSDLRPVNNLLSAGDGLNSIWLIAELPYENSRARGALCNAGDSIYS